MKLKKIGEVELKAIRLELFGVGMPHWFLDDHQGDELRMKIYEAMDKINPPTKTGQKQILEIYVREKK